MTPSSLDLQLENKLEPLTQFRRVSALLPRFANTLCIGVHLEGFVKDIKFIEWGNPQSYSESLKKAITDSDLTIFYASGKIANRLKSINTHRARVGAIHSVAISRYNPKLIFYRPTDSDYSGFLKDSKLFDSHTMSGFLHFMDGHAVFTDVPEQAEALFRGIPNLEIIEGKKWFTRSNFRPGFFVFSAPFVATIREDFSHYQGLEVHDELTENKPEFETHIVFRLRQEDADKAGTVANALSDYHATLYQAASQMDIDGVPFMLMAKSLSHVLSSNFPRFSAMIEKNPEVLKNCLSYHHKNP